MQNGEIEGTKIGEIVGRTDGRLEGAIDGTVGSLVVGPTDGTDDEGPALCLKDGLFVVGLVVFEFVGTVVGTAKAHIAPTTGPD